MAAVPQQQQQRERSHAPTVPSEQAARSHASAEASGRAPCPDGAIAAHLAMGPTGAPADVLRRLIDARLDRLPRPGGGRTLQRWRALETVARHDLALVKLYESHVDALAILHEIDRRDGEAGVAYAVWASESRVDPIGIDRDGPRPGEVVRIAGRKSWCSGAALVDAGLMTATDASGRRYLVEVEMHGPGIAVDDARWNAVGMRDSDSFDVVCDGATARVVGPPDAYLARPGFWHGGAGVAACWYGAAAAIGSRVRDLQAGRDDVHALAHLGAIDAALASGAALLREAAAAIDAGPRDDAARLALRVRGAIADLADVVIRHAGRAVGPGPLCQEADFARRVADLPIFVRQCRSEHDRVAQARALLADAHETSRPGWTL